MVKGFYNLASGVLTHQRNLNVIANNMVNTSTAGFKQEDYVASTFDEVMYSRVGNQTSVGTEIGPQSYIRATAGVYTDFTQGVLEPTNIDLDFAIEGDGFFCVNGEGGQFYTRMGSFSLDEEGYLCLPGFGRVQGTNGQAMQIKTDRIVVDTAGNIRDEADNLLGTIAVYRVEDTAQLQRNEQGMFVAGGGQLTQEARIIQGYLERSNTDVVAQMTDMISVQRSLQSATQVMKIYDGVLTKATTELGRL